LVASAEPTIATSADESPEMALPEVMVHDVAPTDDELVVAVVPVTWTGGTKVPEDPPPNGPPSEPPEMGEVRFVVAFEFVLEPPNCPPPDEEPGLLSLPVTDSATDTTCGVDLIVAMFAALRGFPPPNPNPPNPAGATVISVPDEDDTAEIRCATAWCERIMTRASPKLIPRMSTIESVRMELRKAFLVPRRIEPIYDLQSYVSQQRTTGSLTDALRTLRIE
jgi:hypothetical protein